MNTERPDRGSSSPKTVPTELAGARLDRAVHELFGLSWARARSAIQTGKLFVDGAVAMDLAEALRQGQRLALVQNAPKPSTAKRLAFEEGAIEFVDASVVVVRKPPGISTIPYGDESPEEQRSTLDALVREMLKRRFGSRAPGGRAPLGVVHRLDKDTSGLLVFTRTVEAKQALGEQFRKHTVHRRYLAVVHGALLDARSYKSYFVENRGDGLRGSVLGHRRDGQLAVTHVTPLEPLRGATLVACTLETGRTHQIRIHLSEAGHPLVGEAVYIRHKPGPFLPAPRILLHAAELGFEHPSTGETLFFRQPVPDDFRAAVEGLRLPGAKGPIDAYLERPTPRREPVPKRGESATPAATDDKSLSRAALRRDAKLRHGTQVGPDPRREPDEDRAPEAARRKPPHEPKATRGKPARAPEAERSSRAERAPSAERSSRAERAPEAERSSRAERAPAVQLRATRRAGRRS